MNYLKPSKEKEIFAVLKTKEHNLVGRVISISDSKIVFNSVSEGFAPVDSFQHMDVFTTGHIYFRDLPVRVISENKIQDERSFSKMLTREFNVTFDNSDVAVLIPLVKRR
jgi:hypothetical protein